MNSMHCSNCQKEYTSGAICPHCNVDAVLHAGTVRLSEKLYNKGLHRLTSGDMSQGIELLSRSVSVNKHNITARNLLGLALYEIGHVGDALKHWGISQSLVEEENPAAQYITDARKNSRAFEAQNDAIQKYNQALTYLSQKSDDLAIIQLKRAVELNPRFIDALNLLALCHLIQNDRAKAAAAAERTLAIDAQNAVALNYLTVINPNRAKPSPRLIPKRGETQKNTPVPTYKAMNIQEKKAKNFRLDIILALIFGAACTFAVIYVLFYPAIHRQYANQMQGYQNRINAAEQARRDDASQHAQAILEKEQLLDDYRHEISNQYAANELLDRQIRIFHADNLYRDGNLLDAIDRLDGIDMTDIPRDLTERVEAIRASAYPRLFAHFQAEGVAASNANDRYKALVDFDMATRFRTEDTLPTANFLFAFGSLIANDEQLAGDETRRAQAIGLLEELRERFPNHMRNTTIALIDGLRALDE